MQSYSHRSAGQTSLCGQDPLSAGDRLGFPQRGGPKTPKRPKVLVGRKLAKLGRPALSRGELEGLRGRESEFTGMAFPRGGGVFHYWGIQAEAEPYSAVSGKR